MTINSNSLFTDLTKSEERGGVFSEGSEKTEETETEWGIYTQK